MNVLAFIALVIQFVIVLFQTFFSEKAKKDQADAANAKADEEFQKLVVASLEKWRENRKKRSSQARDMDRQMEDDRPN